MIRTLIFDIGQVLIQFRGREYINEFGFDQDTSEKLYQATVSSPWWVEMDRGLSKEAAKEGMKAMYPELAKELEIFFNHTYRIVKPFDYARNLLKQLKEMGYKIYLLSNYGEDMFLESVERFTFREFTDGEVISYREKVIKPEREIYQILLERYQIQPEEAIFIDDNEANIKGAQAVGLHTILFHDYEQLKKELYPYEIMIQ